MPVNVQIRNVPDDVHAEIVKKAKARGMSLSSYLRNEVIDLHRRLDFDEWVKLIKTRRPARIKTSSVQIIREMRDGR